MILADKIIKLRKQFGWSQEELAEKMNVSRQSVSKWESTTSIPDLKKILLMAEIFGVTTDYLLKDEIEEVEATVDDSEPGIVKITLEQATTYIQNKIEASKLIAIGTLLSICCVVPLFFLLALAENESYNITSDAATVGGMISLLVMIAIAVSFFIRSNQFNEEGKKIEEEEFDLAYGVRSIIKEKRDNYRRTYTQRLSISIAMIIVSSMPLIAVGTLTNSDNLMILMLVVLFLIVGIAVYIMIPSVMKFNAYNCLISEGDYAPKKKDETKRSEKLAAFYWPLVTAIYLGWSFWTMDWGTTWIVWPVAGVAFAALIGLVGMFEPKNN